MDKRDDKKRVVVIVEGVVDQNLVEELGRRLKRDLDLEIKPVKMDGNDLDKAYRMILAHEHRYDLFVVLKDQHRHSESQLRKLIDMHLLSRLSRDLRNRVNVVLVRRAIEAWILGDPEALHSLCPGASFDGDPEEVEEPDAKLRELLERCGKRYIKTPEWGRKLGQAINPEANRTRSFREFIEMLRDP